MTATLLDDPFRLLADSDLCRRNGRVLTVIGLVIEAGGLQAAVGERCTIERSRQGDSVPAEVVGFREGKTLLMPLGEMAGIAPGNRVLATGVTFELAVGEELLGRVLDGLGSPIDGGLPLLDGDHPPLLRRRPATIRSAVHGSDSRLPLGVRAPSTPSSRCGRGQRLGDFCRLRRRQVVAARDDRAALVAPTST